MTETWLLAALWLGLALVATLLSIWLRVATALSEIVVGTVAQLNIGATLGTALLHTDDSWIKFLSGTGAIVLTFLAGCGGAVSIPLAHRSTSKNGSKMNQVARICIVIVLTTVLIGCVTAAPRADQVKFTNNLADVSACTEVGNISAEEMNSFDPHVARNVAVGWSANVVFRTRAGGVAYRCGNAAVPGQ
jgi:Kef-type K+ transport system membrane component KefB